MIRKTIKGSTTEYIFVSPCAEIHQKWERPDYAIEELLSDCLQKVTYISQGTDILNIKLESESERGCFIDLNQSEKSIFVRRSDHIDQLHKDLDILHELLSNPHMSPDRAIYLVSDNISMTGCSNFSV
jgi:hypothetical protein